MGPLQGSRGVPPATSVNGSDRSMGAPSTASVGTAEDVANAADGVDECRIAWVRLDPAPQPVDVDVHGPRLAAIVIAPHVLEQLVAGEDLARMADLEREQLECLWLDGEDLAV